MTDQSGEREHPTKADLLVPKGPAMRCVVHGTTFIGSDNRCHHTPNGFGDCAHGLEAEHSGRPSYAAATTTSMPSSAEKISMTAKPQNYGMIQLVWREIDEEEPLTLLQIGGIGIWRDAESKVVIVDVPPGYESKLIGHEPEELPIL